MTTFCYDLLWLGSTTNPGGSDEPDMIWTMTPTPPPEIPHGRPLLCVRRIFDNSPYVAVTYTDLHGNTFTVRLKWHNMLPSVGEWTMRVRDEAIGHMVFIDPQPSLAALRQFCETTVRVNVEPGCWEGIAPPSSAP